MKKRVVIALGGNAIQNKGEKGTFEDQLANVSKTMANIVPPILNKDYQVIITHAHTLSQALAGKNGTHICAT